MSKYKDVRKAQMVKTLRITSIVVVVLAAGFIVSPAIFGLRGDAETEEFLNSPGAIEKFNEARDNKSKGSESQTSPVVKLAEAFALYLNPPTPPKKVSEDPPKSSSPVRPPVVSSKFKLIGTSYYVLRPELSLALIDEPGKGYRWVRQSSEVGHLIIEQVKDGTVVVRDGQRTSELVAERPVRMSLLKRSSFEPAGSVLGLTSPDKSAVHLADKSGPGITEGNVPMTGAEEPAYAESLPTDAASKEALEDILGRLRNVRRDANEGDGSLEQLIGELEAMRVNTEEAGKLSGLGEELEQEQGKPIDPNFAKSEKVERPKKTDRSSEKSAEK